MELAIDHLVALGHRDTVLLSGSQEKVSYRLYGPYERGEAAYRRIAEENGMRPTVMRCPQSALAGREAAARLIAEAPKATAVLAADEASAAGLVAGLHQQGRRIPADISVISVSNSKEMAAVSDPPLTVVTAPGLELGALGVEALLRRLRGDPPQEPVLRAGTFELGESTGPAKRRGPKRRV